MNVWIKVARAVLFSGWGVAVGVVLLSSGCSQNAAAPEKCAGEADRTLEYTRSF